MEKINTYKRNAFIITLLILSIGVYMVYSASHIFALYFYNDSYYYLKRQLLFALIGIIALFIGYKISLKLLKKYLNVLIILSFLLLILVLIPFIGIERGGSSSWLGFSELSFQPSEFFKIVIILYFASFLSEKYKDTKKIKSLIFPLIMLMIGIVLIMLQPDFGTSMVIIASIILLLFCSRLPIKYFLFSFILLVAFIVILILIAPYRLTRITSFIDPFSDPLGSGFQMIQSLFSVSPGGLLGLGIDASIQKYFYLPEPQTDFIYAIIVEEFGLFGGLIIIVLYGLLFYYFIKIILNTHNLFQAYFSLGLLSLFIVQVLINLGVVIGLLPVTGITLPLISYGGSSMCILLFSFGLMLHKDIKDEK